MPGASCCLIAADATLTSVTPTLALVMGAPTDSLVGRSLFDLVHPDDRSAMIRAWHETLQGDGDDTRIECRLRDGAGGWRVVEGHASNLLADPDIDAVVVHLHDVTEHQLANDALRLSEARLRSIVDNSTDGLVLVDDESRVQWASPAAGEILGYEPAAVVGTHVLDFVHPDDLDAALPSLLRVVEGRSIGEPVRVRVRRADGEWRWVEALTRRFEGGVAPDEAETAIVFSLRDVTDRVIAELARQESELRFRTVVQNSYDVVAVIDATAVIKWVTPNVLRLLGWTPVEIEGTNGLDLVHPDDHDDLAVALAEYAAGEGIQEPDVVKMRHKDGSWRHVEIVGTDFLNHPGIEGIALNLRGVDERIAAEADRQRLIDMFELTSDLVLIGSVEGRLVYRNRSAEKFFGVDWARDDERTNLARWLTPDSLGRLDTEVGAALAQGGSWSGDLELVRGDGRIVPVLAQILGHHDADGNLAYVSSITRDISERKAFELRLQHEASHDPLTGLPNRTLLLDRLTVALARGQRHGGSVAVLFCDLDHFKVVNDSLGHGQGDRVIVEVARRLQSELRPEDTVSRFGGDEFVIVCEDLEDPDEVQAIAGRVHSAFDRPFDLDGTDVHIGVSIGIALGHGGSDSESLIRDADAAMYRAKARGRNRSQFFEPYIWHQAVDRFDLENALRQAVARDELLLYYQPVFDLRTRAAVGVEALVRWQHPDRGLILPGEFIFLAEETGLVVPLGAWVINEAARQMRAWQTDRSPLADLWLAVNISGRQLEHADFVSELAEVTTAGDFDPERLHLEITESVLMDDVEYSELTLSRLKALGVKLAVDDFGTGYSSLSYLRRFPVDSLKVDRSFVDGLGTEPGDSTIVAAVVNLAQTLGLVSIAEGVENVRQRDRLEEMGCDLAQGFLLAEPMPAAALAHALAARIPNRE